MALAVNADSLSTWLPAALAAVDPPVCFDLRRADETRTAELLRDGSVTAAVTALGRACAGLRRACRWGRMRYRPRAAAGFVERWFARGRITRACRRLPWSVRSQRRVTGPIPATPIPATASATPSLCSWLDGVRRGGAPRTGLGHGAGSADGERDGLIEFDPEADRRGPLLAAVAIEFGGSLRVAVAVRARQKLVLRQSGGSKVSLGKLIQHKRC